MPQKFAQALKFEYRRPRYKTDVPAILRCPPLYNLYGRCKDVSSEGLGVKLVGELPIGETVAVEFSLAGCSVNATAEIAYRRNSDYYGLRFKFSSEQERDS